MSHSIIINGQTIKLPQSTTGGSSLFVLGHAFYTSQSNNGNFTAEIKVSEEDRLDFLNELESAQLWLNESINCIGELLTDIQYKEIDGASLKNLGYLITGLSELQRLTKETRDMTPVPTSKELL